MNCKKIWKFLCLTCICLICLKDVCAYNNEDYKTVKKGSLVVYLNPEFEDDSETISTDYQLLKRKSEDNDLFDSYILESVSYYSKGGSYFKIDHFTNDSAIVFESYDSQLTKLISGENSFIAFFSSLNNIMNGKMLVASKTINTWEVERTFYAMKRYFDNEYSFKYVTYFSVPKDNEVRVSLNLYGSFEGVEMDVNTIDIKYNLKEASK